ncbi:MAG: hypothetical protein C4323_23740, partial [Mastigocladus sp. ERB_26_2]
MNNFVFQNPVKILFGRGQIANIANEIPTDAIVLVTYGMHTVFEIARFFVALLLVEEQHILFA